jgi:hypothetical protein
MQRGGVVSCRVVLTNPCTRKKKKKEARVPVCLVSCTSNGDAIEPLRNIVFVFSFCPSKGASLVFHKAVGAVSEV